MIPASRRRTRFFVRLSATSLCIAALAISLVGAGADIPRGAPDEVGLSAARLTRINDVV